MVVINHLRAQFMVTKINFTARGYDPTFFTYQNLLEIVLSIKAVISLRCCCSGFSYGRVSVVFADGEVGGSFCRR